MFAFPRAPVPMITYGQTLTNIDAKKVARIQISRDNKVSYVENRDGTINSVNLIPTESLIERAHANDVDIIIPQISSANIFSYLPYILGAILLLRTLSERGMGAARQIANAGMKFDVIEETGVTFDDVAGIDEVSEEVREIIDFLKKPEKFEAIGAKVPRGCILSGQPGTGKTLLAKAIAGEAGVPFISASASQFVELFVGLGASRIRSLFKQARENNGCIIFIDEIDAIGKARGSAISGAGNDEREQTLNQLLTEMDGFNPNSGIIVMAATNRPDILDPALLRPGRFDRNIRVSLPDKNERIQILKVHAKNKKFDARVSLENIAQLTPGSSGAQLANILNEAAIHAVRNSRSYIKVCDVQEAVDKTMIGLKKKRDVSSTRKMVVAYHEAGHAIAGAVLRGIHTVQKVSITPRGPTAGVTMFNEANEEMTTLSDLKDMIMISLAGTAAEELVFGKEFVTTGAEADIQKATKIAEAITTRYGMTDTIGKRFVAEGDEKTTEVVRRIIASAYTETLSMIRTYRSSLDSVAKCLVEEEEIDSERFAGLLDFCNLIPPPPFIDV